jgi:hypothetical protein
MKKDEIEFALEEKEACLKIFESVESASFGYGGMVLCGTAYFSN